MSLKILGTGLGRTGTTSLKLALEYLTGERCFHMFELMENPNRLKYLKKGAKNGHYDWGAIFEGYTMSVDYPTSLLYKELVNDFPNVKIIHTVRDPESWYDSVSKTIYRSKPKTAQDFFRLFKNLLTSGDMRRIAPVFMYADEMVWKGQFESRFMDKEFAIQKYLEHTEAVKLFVKRPNLLVYDIRDGWPPLCDFLGCPRPTVSFPMANTNLDFTKKMDKLLLEGVYERIA